MPTARVELPLLTSSVPSWLGLQPLAEAPEPLAPQGAYGTEVEAVLDLPPIAPEATDRSVELLAPAGSPDSAFAAYHFGADAIYLGLKKFSARAEAENFTLDEVNEITAYAHSLEPRRRVFVTVNTLIRQDELPELVEAVAALADIGVDALIIQDLGVYHLVRRYFPDLELHASTQLSVHNRAGAEVLKQLGFRRAVLARELTFEEVRDITATAGIETEVFIHGALCYSYSGLCLFSSQTLGRSGNRGRCAYSCRDAFEVSGAPQTLRDGSPVKRNPAEGFPFSMKDLALPDHIPALRAAGVSCFKIEGRKKSPLYVGTTTDYYRRLIDGKLSAEERPAREADLQTVFSRPWTRLFVQSHQDKEVADRDTVGHRGTPIGRVEQASGDRLRFRTTRALERHDGLQVDLPTLGKPFGFAVERLWLIAPGRREKRQEVFEAPAGALVEVSLPRDHPSLPVNAPVYCSSSQVVKREYRFSRPKPGLYRTRKLVEVEIVLTDDRLTAKGRISSRQGAVEVERYLAGPFAIAKDPAAMEVAVRGAFDKLGPTGLELVACNFRNDAGRFVPVSRLNQLRRELAEALEEAAGRCRAEEVGRIQNLLAKNENGPRPSGSASPRSLTVAALRWSLKVDRLAFLDAFADDDFAGVEEVIVDIARDSLPSLQMKLEELDNHLGRERLRLALPALTRFWEDKVLRRKISELRSAGWKKWEAANLSAWSYLETEGIDLSTDWSIYVVNRLAARQLLDLGVQRFTLSPEDGLANVHSLLAEFGPQATLIVYQDTPLFLAESCAYANLIGGCPGKANCRFEQMDMVSTHGERVTALDYHCRTIVLNQQPFSLSHRLNDLARAGAVNLRADFIYRQYDPVEVRERWRLIRAGRPVPGGQAANFDRGML